MVAANKRKFGPPSGPQKIKLTDREDKLAQGIAGGLTLKAAYKRAGYSADVRSGETAPHKRPLVLKRLKWLRERQIERLDYTIDNIAARLEAVYDGAMEAKQYSAAGNAMMGIAKLMGYLADRHEIEMHIISKPSREPTKEISLTPEEWQRQFAPKAIN